MTAVLEPRAPGSARRRTRPRRRGIVGYLLMLPGSAWLLLFFMVPVVVLILTSLYDPSGTIDTGYNLTWQFSNFKYAVDTYHAALIRAFVYAIVTTVICLAVGFPLAYAIAFKAGRWKNLMLVAVIAPSFVSSLIRTLAWKYLLADHGWVVGFLHTIHVLDPEQGLLFTGPAVVTGLVYYSLPFTVLPMYASLEKIDRRLIEAGADLYASPATTLTKVTVPLAMPGVVAGTLLTFIPAAGDYINAQLLGSTSTTMVGNIIQSLFSAGNYPIASALSAILMAIIIVLVLLYVRRAGTEELV